MFYWFYRFVAKNGGEIDMAHIPMDDINEIWQNAPHNWEGLKEHLHTHEEKAKGISDTLVYDMEDIADKMKSSGKNFPPNPQELYDMLNQQVGGAAYE